MFIAKLPTPPAGAVSQRVRFFKDGEFSHLHELGLDEKFATGTPDLTATVDYGDEAGEQVGETLPITFEAVLDAPPEEPAPEPEPAPVEPAEETETQPESTEVAQ